MKLLATDEHGVRTLRLVGNFEPTDVVRFERLIDESVDAGITRIVVDAADVRLVCSAALSAFLRTQARLAKERGSLVMAGLPHFAGVLFETLGLDRRIRCFESTEDAARYVAGAAD